MVVFELLWIPDDDDDDNDDDQQARSLLTTLNVWLVVDKINAWTGRVKIRLKNDWMNQYMNCQMETNRFDG